jgi:hypothetical protein
MQIIASRYMFRRYGTAISKVVSENQLLWALELQAVRHRLEAIAIAGQRM